MRSRKSSSGRKRGRQPLGYLKGVDTVRVDLPADRLQAAKLDFANPSQEAARLLALELFREEKISLGRAAELCRTPLAAFMDFAAAHEVSPIRYGLTELEEDRRTLAELGL
jgi:predicted HTH domain antitoxin